MAATTIQIWVGSEAQRRVSLAVPNLRDIVITDERGLYIGDGVTPLSGLQIAYEPTGTAAGLLAPIAALLQQLAARPVPAPRSVEISPAGQMKVGLTARGPIVNVGFPAAALRVFADHPPTGSALVFDVVDNIGTVYAPAVTLPADAPYFENPTLPGTYIGNGVQMKLNVTAVGSTFPGSGVTVQVVADMAGSTGSGGGGIGSVSALTAPTVGATSTTLAWGYTGDTPPASYTIVWKQGDTPPASLTDGSTTTVDGTASTAQITGLTSGVDYSYLVVPIAADGTPGTGATLAAITTSSVADQTAPGQITAVTHTEGQTSISFGWAWPGDPDVAGVIVREKNNTGSAAVTWAPLATMTTEPTEGHPSVGALSATGPGYRYTIDQGSAFTRSGLTANTWYSFAFYTYDSSGNINQTPVVVNVQTAAATTGGGGLGILGKIPGGYNKLWSDAIQAQDLTAFIGAKQTLPGFEWWGNAKEGPSAHSNVDTIVDPILGAGHYVLRLRQRRIVGGWMDSTTAPYKNHKGWFTDGAGGYTTDGTGTYGARVDCNRTTSQASGACEITWWMANVDGTAATAMGNNCKGLTIMWFPDANWPKDEIDFVELFNARQLGANNHFLTAIGGNGQVHAGTTDTYLGQPFNIFAPITTLVLWEPPTLVAGTGGVSPTGQAGGFGRMRIFHKQTGVAGDGGVVGAPLTWFDTDKPYVGINMTDDTVWRLLSQQQKGNLGIACAWQPGSVTYDKATDSITGGARFGAATGTTATTRGQHAGLIRDISWWGAAAL